eukprot:SAG11_NODE_10357_length_837_cov_1.306233_2_plen_107_part_00
MSDAKPEGLRPKDTGSGMTPSQRYLFDLTGFLHIRGAVSGAELEAAQTAIERLIATPRHEREAAGFTHQADGNYPPRGAHRALRARLRLRPRAGAHRDAPVDLAGL